MYQKLYELSTAIDQDNKKRHYSNSHSICLCGDHG